MNCYVTNGPQDFREQGLTDPWIGCLTFLASCHVGTQLSCQLPIARAAASKYQVY